MKIDPEKLGSEVTPKLTSTIKYLDEIIDAVGKLKYPIDMNDEHKRYIISIPQKIKDIQSSINGVSKDLNEVVNKITSIQKSSIGLETPKGLSSKIKNTVKKTVNKAKKMGLNTDSTKSNYPEETQYEIIGKIEVSEDSPIYIDGYGGGYYLTGEAARNYRKARENHKELLSPKERFKLFGEIVESEAMRKNGEWKDSFDSSIMNFGGKCVKTVLDICLIPIGGFFGLFDSAVKNLFKDSTGEKVHTFASNKKFKKEATRLYLGKYKTVTVDKLSDLSDNFWNNFENPRNIIVKVREGGTYLRKIY